MSRYYEDRLREINSRNSQTRLEIDRTRQQIWYTNQMKANMVQEQNIRHERDNQQLQSILEQIRDS